ncbi:MAG: TetR/AcrR family transcriptional regulator [Ignavibacteria bacterium]|nr:TetR/AcrR family transcriptional regulator [Ignavibacteria bacterium]
MKKQNIRSAILQLAMTSLLENGFKNFNVDVLVENLGISKATFYKYYPSKAILFELCVKEKLEAFRKSIKAQVSKILNSTKASFFNLFMQLMTISSDFFYDITKLVDIQVSRRFPHIALRLKKFTKNQIEQNFYSMLEKGKELGLIRKDLNDQVLYLIVFSTLTNLREIDEKIRDEITISQFLIEYFTILFNGILLNENKELFYKQRDSFIYEK